MNTQYWSIMTSGPIVSNYLLPNQNHLYYYFNDTLFINESSPSVQTVSTNLNQTNLLFSPALTVLIAIIAGIMSCVTILGNVLVITAFIIDKNLRKYSNYFILNLSIADLLIGLLIPPYAPFLLYNRIWKLGRVACTIWLVLDYVVGSASVLCIVVISLDRYLLVSRGLKYVADQKISKAICIMITVWAIAFLNYAPAIIFWELISGRRTTRDDECQVGFHDSLVYLTATACVEFFAPLISICSLNLAVYLNIRKRSRGLIRSENPHFTLDKSISMTQTVPISNDNATKSKATKSQSLSSKPNNSETKSPSILLKKIKRQHQSKLQNIEQKKRPTLVSASSTTCSTSSLDDLPVNNNNNKSNKKNCLTVNSSSLKKQQNQLTESEILLNDLNKNGKSNLNSTNINLNMKSCLSQNPNPRQSIIEHPSRNSTYEPHQNFTTNSKILSTKKTSSTRATLTKDKKAARSLFILVFVFVICWAPYTFLTLIKSVCNSCVGDSVYELAFWLLWINSTFNPILYPFLHVKFRKAFLKIFRCIFFCFKYKSQYNHSAPKSEYKSFAV